MVKANGLTLFALEVFQSKRFWGLKGKHRVALLDDVKVVFVITEGTVETVVIHFRQHKLDDNHKKTTVNANWTRQYSTCQENELNTGMILNYKHDKCIIIV